MSKKSWILIFLVFMAAGCLFAQADSTQAVKLMEALKSKTPESSFSVFFRTILSLVIVIGLVYVVMIGLQRFIRRDSGRVTGSMKILSSLPLGVKKHVMIVQVEDRRLVLGVTEHQVTFLSELDKETPEEYQQQSEEPGHELSRNFQSILKRMMQK